MTFIKQSKCTKIARNICSMNKSILKRLRRAASIVNVVVIPIMVISAYYVFVASERYVSKAVFSIKEADSSRSMPNLGLLGIASSPSHYDHLLVKEYIESPDMLMYLDSEVGLKDHYSNSDIDWISSLGEDPTREEFLEYYRQHIGVIFDEASGLMHVEVQAFNPVYATRLLNVLLQQVESNVNLISHNLMTAQYEFVSNQVINSQNALKRAKQKLIEFQNKNKTFSPELMGGAINSTMMTLEGELTSEEVVLKELSTTYKESSPAVSKVKERVRALKQQIDEERQRLISKDDGGELNLIIAEYTDLQLDLDFAKKYYASTLESLEIARADASRKLKYLVTVSKPTMADEPTYPDKPYIIVTVSLILMMLYGIVRMVHMTIMEHLD